MAAADWTDPKGATLAFRLDGEAFADERNDGRGDASFLVLLNGEREETLFTVPPAGYGEVWRVAIDTRERPIVGDLLRAAQTVQLSAGSLVVLTSEIAPSIAPPPVAL
jgi:isoamylase